MVASRTAAVCCCLLLMFGCSLNAGPQILSPKQPCRGTDTSAKELAGLRSEKEGIQRELSALRSIHTKDSRFSRQETDDLRQARTFLELL